MNTAVSISICWLVVMFIMHVYKYITDEYYRTHDGEIYNILLIAFFTAAAITTIIYALVERGMK